MKKNKITIELHSIIKDIVRNIWIVFLCALIGFMGLYVMTHGAYEPEYTSTATLSVVANTSNSTSISNLGISNEMANVYTTMFSEPTLKEYAAEHLGIEKFDGTVSATVLENTNFLQLKVTSSAPMKSYELLSALLEVHPKISKEIFNNATIAVVRAPSIPSAPSNRVNNENRNLVVTACVTLSLGIIVILSLLRNTVKKESDFEEKIESKLIGTISHENKKMTLQDVKQKKKKGLLIHSNAYISLRFTENFHKIASKLEHMKNRGDGKVFAITSVAENEGKSTCAANLAVSLADRGNKVILLDFDFKKPALFKIFEEKSEETSELSEILKKEISVDDFKFGTFKKLSLSLAINTNPDPDYKSYIENGSLAELLDELRKQFDFVIVDTAPLSLDSAVTDIIQKVDKTILVIRTDTVNVTVLNDHIATISKISANLAGCILNDVYMNILPFSITGNDESNYYGGYSYGKYSHYGHYGSYGKHHKRKAGKEEMPKDDSPDINSSHEYDEDSVNEITY